MVRSPILLLLGAAFLVAGPAAADEKKESASAIKARAMLAAADKLAYRPLADGLKDLTLEFSRVTRQGKLRGLWPYRAATKKLPTREKRTVKNVKEKSRRRLLVTGLKRQFALVTAPVLRRPFADLAEGMDLAWDAEGRKVKLTARKDLTNPPKHTRIVVTLSSDGLPASISWFHRETDPEDPMEKEMEIERSANYEWSKIGGRWVVTMSNSNRTGARLIAKYEYAAVKGILLPKKVEEIDPLGGVEKIPLENIRVNEGIGDEEFSRW